MGLGLADDNSEVVEGNEDDVEDDEEEVCSEVEDDVEKDRATCDRDEKTRERRRECERDRIMRGLLLFAF